LCYRLDWSYHTPSYLYVFLIFTYHYIFLTFSSYLYIPDGDIRILTTVLPIIILSPFRRVFYFFNQAQSILRNTLSILFGVYFLFLFCSFYFFYHYLYTSTEGSRFLLSLLFSYSSRYYICILHTKYSSFLVL